MTKLDFLNIFSCLILNFIIQMKNQHKIKILDGAVGSLLQQKFPQFYEQRTWMNRILKEKPEKLYDLHLEYFKQGADIITSFTFKTNPIACQSLEESKKLVQIAVSEAQKLKEISKDIQIYGSNSPAEDCYQKERTLTKDQLIYNHKSHIQFLQDCSVDCIFNETMSQLDELIIVCQICQDMSIPYIISIYFDNSLKILSRESVDDCVDILLNQHKFKPMCLSFNCVQKKDLLNLFLQQKKIFKQNSSENFFSQNIKYGFYINCGGEDYTCDNFNYQIQPVELPIFYQQLIDFKIIEQKDILFLGTCCMSTPEHTKQLSKFFK
ncbi:hypothetical protein ABPG72_010124 [Tetrahymena utriculariae]